ncbi:hypothetical protein DYB37_010903 [Aphanomyces astaci]|uniref:Prolyl endopeptidase-like n=1 Tax=Aphanomyces astaci TaxID=112090 RepID=A0A418F4W5_APHAT|nr:hypothetical protein DYB37_010903 [Aphanomyces astaci]
MTTFTDFIAVAEHLVATKVTSPSHMTCEGGSAGGLLVLIYVPCIQVAKLRDLKTDNNQVLLKMNLDSGHFSASNRYQSLKEKAMELSFLVDKLKYHHKC